MFEKALHTANIAAAFGVVATAADITFAGGAATTIGAALSTLAIFKKGDTSSKAMAQQLATTMEAAFKSASLPKEQLKHVAQLFTQFPLHEADLAKGNLDAATIAQNMRQHIEAKAKDPAHKTKAALAAYVEVITNTLAPVLAQPAGMDPMQVAMFKELLARSDKSGDSDRLREQGITEKAIIRLAQRIAANTEDVGQAWNDLQNAMDIAVRVQTEGQVQSNHGDFVDTVLKRVADLAKDGEYSTANAEIEDALKQADAQKSRLLASGVEIAALEGNTEKAAERLWAKVQIDVPDGAIQFTALRALRNEWYERGRDKGLNFDAEVAIHLAGQSRKIARNADERGTALNDLGTALATLGTRDADTERLDQAVDAFREALKEFTRDRVPLDWARAQMNLGTALATLGTRDADTERLDQAVAAFREALKEFTRDRVPLDWAMTQMNLGNALQTLGTREAGTERLDQAVDAYREALKEYTRDRAPLYWATAQMNLGNALQTLGTREAGTERLDQAVKTYREALMEFSRDKVPPSWALTQMNLGNALLAIGERQSGTKRLDQAVEAYGEALTERTRDRVPMGWALTKYNQARLEIAFFDKTEDMGRLDVAEQYLLAARELFESAGDSHYLAISDERTANIAQRRSGPKSGD